MILKIDMSIRIRSIGDHKFPSCPDKKRIFLLSDSCQFRLDFDKKSTFHTDNVVVDEIDKIDALTMATDEISRKGSKNIFSLIKEDGR